MSTIFPGKNIVKTQINHKTKKRHNFWAAGSRYNNLCDSFLEAFIIVKISFLL